MSDPVERAPEPEPLAAPGEELVPDSEPVPEPVRSASPQPVSPPNARGYTSRIPKSVVVETFDRREHVPDRSAQEALLLVLLTVDAWLLLALIPSIDSSLSPLWQTFLSLAGGLALGRRWVMDKVLALAGRRGALWCAAVALPLLLSIHGVRKLPLVPLVTLPADAIVRLDGQAEPLIGRRMTLGAHQISVEPRNEWDSKPRVIQVSTMDSWGALFGGAPPTAAVGCQLTISLHPDDVGAVVKIVGKQPFAAALSPLPSSVPVGAVRLRRQGSQAVEIELDVIAVNVELPAGEYELVATRKADETAETCVKTKTVLVVGTNCYGSSPKGFEPLCG